MGNFYAHVLPGLFFIIFATWCTVQIYRRYFQACEKKNPSSFKSTLFFPIHTRKGLIHVDCYIMIVCTTIGILVELVGGKLKINRIIGIMVQHATMYFFFGMLAIFAVVFPKLKVIPKHHELLYVIGAVSFIVEGLLFKFHFDERLSDDVMVHTLLVYTIFATSVVLLLEMKHRENVLVALSRTFLIMLQGTWFWQIGFSLYPPLTDPNGDARYGKKAALMTTQDHERILYLACYFAWHMAVILIMMTSCGGLIGCYFYRKNNANGCRLDEESLLNEHTEEFRKANGVKVLDTIIDDEEEL